MSFVEVLRVAASAGQPREVPLVEMEWVDEPGLGSWWELWVSEDADPPVPLDRLYKSLEQFLLGLPQVASCECTDRYQYQLQLNDDSEAARTSIIEAAMRHVRGTS
jgi:hypothetical protein